MLCALHGTFKKLHSIILSLKKSNVFCVDLVDSTGSGEVHTCNSGS